MLKNHLKYLQPSNSNRLRLIFKILGILLRTKEWPLKNMKDFFEAFNETRDDIKNR